MNPRKISFKEGSPHVILESTNGAVLSGSPASSRNGRSYSSFTGIKFAKIPARFEEAELIKGGDWQPGTVFEATRPGPISPQCLAGSGGQVILGSDEDCLNLNIHVPKTESDELLPVMVFFHGGAFMFGGGYAYGAKYFMDENVILVTVNYRLGVFGFLSTGDSIIPGNNGLKDSVLALQWIQENIVNFLGDPKKIAIFGQSAGAVCVHYLTLSPKTEGLFRGAISESGSALASWAYHPNPKETAKKLVAHMGFTKDNPSSEEIRDFLKTKTIQELGKAQLTFKQKWPMASIPFAFGPVKESNETAESSVSPFLTRSPWDILNDKSTPLREIPWIVGATEDEGASFYAGLILNNEDVVKELNSNWKSISPIGFEFAQYVKNPEDQEKVGEEIRNFYFGDDPISLKNREKLTNLYSDIYFGYPVYKAAMETASRGNKNHPVYLYQYCHHGPGSAMKLLGLPLAEEECKKVGHGDDLLLQFDMDALKPAGSQPGESILKKNSVEEIFSKNLVKLWASFAINGEPNVHLWSSNNTVSLPSKWTSISKDEAEGKLPLKRLRLESDLTYLAGLHKERMEFCDKLWTETFITK